MKKVFAILGIYTAIIFICCIAEAFIYRTVPNLIPSDVGGYRFYRGLYWFLTLLPAILLSGFTVACAVNWQHNVENSKQRFSPAMIERYRNVMISSLFFVLVLALNAELFRPLTKDKLNFFENAPEELNIALNNVNKFIGEEKYELAYLYAERAVKVAPNANESATILKKAKDNLDVYQGKLHKNAVKTVSEEKMPLFAKDHEYSVKELMQRANDAVSKESWFEAHYWATLAMEACLGVDTNLSNAQEIAQLSWNKLKRPEDFGNQEEVEYFKRKKEGYTALDAGDYIKSYYIFLELKKSKTGSDPDVERFLNLAQERLENSYFFIDEAQNVPLLANNHNIYFSLNNPDGSKNVFYIQNALDSKEDGRSIRYLEGLYIATYSANGQFVKLVNAPIAKVTPQAVSVFDKNSCKTLGIDSSWNEVPFVMLLAVDRNTQGVVSEPIYTFEENGLPDSIKNVVGLKTPDTGEKHYVAAAIKDSSTTMILPMPYADFSVIGNASSDVDRMLLLSLVNFLHHATEYGFSEEVFAKSLISRCMYPLFLLILFIMAAAIGWNYRVEGKRVQFKTSWLFLIILYGFVTYLLVEIGTYLFSLFNYVLVGAFKSNTLLIACIFYTVFFAVVSTHFMARQV